MKGYRSIVIALAITLLLTPFLATGSSLALTTAAQAQGTTQKSVVGDWNAALDVSGVKLRLVLHITATGDTLTGTLDSPDQGAVGLKIDSLSFKDGVLKFEMNALGGTYEGKQSSDGKEIDGQWSQQGVSLPLKFTSIASAESASLLKLQRVDVGGHNLNVLVGGKGKVTVVLEGGFGIGIASWSSVQKQIAEFAQTISYDRAGLGQSDPGPKPRTGKQIATELHSALEKVGFKPPYLLVGHSLGGIYVRIFADMFPNEVAGMILIDPSQEDFEEWLRRQPNNREKNEREQIAKAPEGAKLEWAALPETYSLARAAKVPSVPVTLFSSTEAEGFSEDIRKMWTEKHKEWVAKVPGAKHIVLDKSSHFIQMENPGPVIDAVRQLISSRTAQ
jgi:pimeloyl-ACP methyl ester carboxylesterase